MGRPLRKWPPSASGKPAAARFGILDLVLTAAITVHLRLRTRPGRSRLAAGLAGLVLADFFVLGTGLGNLPLIPFLTAGWPVTETMRARRSHFRSASTVQRTIDDDRPRKRLHPTPAVLTGARNLYSRRPLAAPSGRSGQASVPPRFTGSRSGPSAQPSEVSCLSVNSCSSS
jgi:hypothetical protein